MSKMKMTIVVDLGEINMKHYKACHTIQECVESEQRNYDEGVVGVEDYLSCDPPLVVKFELA